MCIRDRYHTIWMGDLNYRINKTREEADRLLVVNTRAELVTHDHLKIEKGAGRVFAGFEEAYGPNERDVNLWKAYFRGHAEFITVDQAILDANERERVARQSQRPPGAGRATRADDVSSDSEEEDCAFDPLVVVRTSSEGRMLSKWLDAARKRLGGTFPRDAISRFAGPTPDGARREAASRRGSVRPSERRPQGRTLQTPRTSSCTRPPYHPALDTP